MLTRDKMVALIRRANDGDGDAMAQVQRLALAAGATKHGGGWLRLPGAAVSVAQGWASFVAYLLVASDDFNGFREGAALVDTMAATLAADSPEPEPHTYGETPTGDATRCSCGVTSQRIATRALRRSWHRAHVEGLRPMPDDAERQRHRAEAAERLAAERGRLCDAQDRLLDELSAKVDELRRSTVPRERFAATAVRVLDGWVDGTKGNHQALGHRDQAEDCCLTFRRDDIVRMFADVERDLRDLP